jgi:tripartite-type tricarboxylate transporter receptor subunit TctC
MKKHVRACVLAAIATVSGTAYSQTYPTRPMRMIVHFPAGGPTDLVARLLAQKMSETWGQQVLVDNRPGAGGVVGVEMVVRAPPDGYTLLFATSGSMSITPAVGTKTPYNVFNDLAPISLVVINPQILVLHPSVPANNVRELIKLAKSKPGQINYASVGIGSPQHLGGEMLKSMTGIDMVHIPYKGTAPAVTDLLAGQVSLMFNSMPSVLPHVRAGRLKGIAVSTARRSAAAPDIPTVAESGVPGFNYATWYGLYAPAATSKDVVAKLNAETVRIMQDKSVAQRLMGEGAEPAAGTPEQLGQYMRSEYEQWKKTIAAAKLKIE